jgi:hypothetical protein
MSEQGGKMKYRSQLGQRATLFTQFWVGGGSVLVGLFTIVADHGSYPPGDQRGGPFFWPLIGAVTAIAGAIILGYAVRDLWRHRRDS